MSTQEEKRYFKVGVFVLLAIALLVGLLLLFSSSALFSKTVYAETYFNESVQGLKVGAAVKFRGIDIGRVQDIQFVSSVYPHLQGNKSYDRYVYVLFSVNSGFVTKMDDQQLKSYLRHAVAQGLRAKLVLQDLSGNAYLELNFTKPKSNPELPIGWKPKHFYIPSTTSSLTRFSDSVETLLNNLKKVDFAKLSDNLAKLAATTNQTMGHVDKIVALSQSSMVKTANNLAVISANLRGVTDQLKENPSSILFDKPPHVDPAKL